MNIKSVIAILATSWASQGVYAKTTNAQTIESADSASISEIVVTGTRGSGDIRHLPMTVTTIRRAEIEASHEQSLLPTVVRRVPGLMVTSRAMKGYGVSTGSSGNISLRGLVGSMGQMLVLIDGHPQYNGIYSHPISDSYNADMAERVEILRGPASMLYGSNAMGGVINIVTRQMDTDGCKTSLNISGGSYGTIETSATAMWKQRKWSTTASANYGRTDNHRPHMGFEQWGGMAKVGYDISKHWSASINASATAFTSRYPGSTDAPVYGAEQWIKRGVASASLTNRYGNSTGEVSVFTSFGFHKIDDGVKDPTASSNRYFRSKDALTGVSAYQSMRLWTDSRLTIGVDYQHIYGRAYYTSKETGEVLNTANKQSGRSYRNEIAGYADLRQDLMEWMTIDAGLRIDHHSVTGTELIPQVGMVARTPKAGEFKVMASKGYRNPTMRELYLYPPSNEELEPERIWNYELSWRRNTKGFNYGVNIFYIKGDNMIQVVNRKNVNTGKIENHGIEIDMEYPLDNHLTVYTNHSWLKMKNPVVAAPEYKGVFALNYHYGKWNVALTATEFTNLYTAVGENETKGSFMLLDLSASYRANSMLTLWARGENLLAERYEINLGYPMPKATAMAGICISL